MSEYKMPGIKLFIRSWSQHARHIQLDMARSIGSILYPRSSESCYKLATSWLSYRE